MRSIRRQLTRELVSVTLLLLCASCLAIYFSARTALVEQFDQTLRAEALAVGALFERESGRLYLETPDQLPKQYGSGKHRSYFEVRDSDDSLIARSASLENALLYRLKSRSETPYYWNIDLPKGRPGRAVVLSFIPRRGDLRQSTEPDKPAFIVVAGDREELDENLHWLLIIAAGSGALLLAATLWIVPSVLRRGLQPLASLGEHTASINADSLGFRFDVAHLPLELKPITTRLNELLARLEFSFERERRVNADLAHELRTPIAELKTLAETTLKWPSSRDPMSDHDVLEIALHLENIVVHMLALARSENGTLPIIPVSVYVPSLVDSSWQSFAERARKKDIRITFALAPVRTLTDSALLRSILVNLFENAVEYATRDSEIVVTCGAAPYGEVYLAVTNHTLGLSASDLDRLFERFWRKEAARTTGSHLGLGLSLVHAFVHALGWQVCATLDQHQMLTIRLTGKVEPGTEA